MNRKNVKPQNANSSNASRNNVRPSNASRNNVKPSNTSRNNVKPSNVSFNNESHNNVRRSNMKRKKSLSIPWLWSGIQFLIIAVIIFCVSIYFLQNFMIFHHVMDHESHLYVQGRPEFHEVEIITEDEKVHHGVMRRVQDRRAPLIIYFGGNAEVSYGHMYSMNRSNMWPYFSGYHYLFIDYDGYGLNRGRANYQNMQEVALAAFDYAVSHPYVDSRHIVVMGFSLGTHSAVYLAANRPVEGLILLAAYANGYDLYNNVLPIFRGPMTGLVRQKLPSDYYAPMVSSPVLIIASYTDEIIPYDSAEYLSTLFPGSVDFMTLMGVSHNEVFVADGVPERIQSFLERIQ